MEKTTTTTSVLGTRLVQIRDVSEALLVISRLDKEDDQSTRKSTVQLSVSTGTTVYTVPSPIDVTNNTKLDSIHEFASHLLSPSAEDGISLMIEPQNDDGGTIKLSLRQRLESGLVKLLYSGVMAEEETNSNLNVLKLLSTTISQEQTKFNELQEECNTLKSDLEGWKDTATKLDLQHWQAEKDALVQHFFTLHQATHEELKKTKLELQQLEHRHVAAGNDYNVRSNKRRPIDQHAPDDQDQVLYDMTTIDRLAAGPIVVAAPPAPKQRSTTAAAKSTALKKSSKPPASSTKAAAKQAASAEPAAAVSERPAIKKKDVARDSAGRIRLGDGAVAVSSVEDLLHDPALSGTNKRKHSKRTSDNDDDTTTSSKATKKPKISSSVDEEKRKKLEAMAAILDDDDDDDW